MGLWIKDWLNMTVPTQSGGQTVQPLDTFTLDRVYCHVCLVLENMTRYRLVKNNTYNDVKEMKHRVMKKAKAE